MHKVSPLHIEEALSQRNTPSVARRVDFMKSPWVWILLLGIALLTLIPASQLPRLEVDTSNQSMSAQQQPIHPTTDRPSLLIAVHGNQPLTFPQWRQLSELSLAINQSPGVTQALLPLISAEGWTVRLLQQFSPQATERLQDLLRLLRSKDGKTVGILVLLEPQAAIGPTTNTNAGPTARYPQPISHRGPGDLPGRTPRGQRDRG